MEIEKPKKRRHMTSLPQMARRATKERIYPLGVKIATQSYIHGIKEMYESHSRPARIFWTSLFLLCLGAALYEIYQIFHLWRDEGVATKISMETVPSMQFPVVLFCPTNWLNKTKADELKIENRTIKYLLSILHPVNNRIPGGYYWPRAEDKAMLRQALDDTGSRSVADLMMKMAMDKKSLTCSCCNGETIEPYVTKFGVCYIVGMCETPFQTHNVPSIIFSIETKHTLFGDDRSAASHSGFVTLFEDRNSIAFSTQDLLFLSPNVPVLIRLTLTMVKRISTRKKPCHTQAYPFASVFRCELDCYDRTENQRCKNCSMFSILQEEPVLEPCGKEHSVRECPKSEVKLIMGDFLECKKSCVPPCTERIFSTTTASAMTTMAHRDSGDNATERLTAMFLFTSFTETLFEDVEIFNFDTFVSSLGGQAGLWCGASIISLFHLLSYCCCPCLHSGVEGKRRGSYDSIHRHRKRSADEREEEVVEVQKPLNPENEKSETTDNIVTRM